MTTAQYVIGTPGQSPRMIVTADAATAALQAKTGEVCFIAPDPFIDPPHVISADGTTLTAAPVSLTVVKSARWTDAQTYRDSIANGTCATPSGTVQTDDPSKLRINGAVAMAMLAKSAGTAFSINWTLDDNTIVTLTADEMIAVGVAVGQFVAACQNAGTAIRDQIDNAADAATVAAIDVTAGYPSP